MGAVWDFEAHPQPTGDIFHRQSSEDSAKKAQTVTTPVVTWHNTSDD